MAIWEDTTMIFNSERKKMELYIRMWNSFFTSDKTTSLQAVSGAITCPIQKPLRTNDGHIP